MLKSFITWIVLFLFAQHVFAIPQPVSGKKGMVVSEQHLATDVGASILRSGGNAVDAAVAVGYALAVVHPCCGNLGGGGFITLHLANGKNIFLNFRERAPLAATPNMYLDAKHQFIPGKSTLGYQAVAVPGTVLGFETILKKYGTMTRQQVMAPAIALAKKGYILTEGDIAILEYGTKQFTQNPNVAAIFLKNNKPYQAGDRLVQKDLAATLSLISQQGPKVFYHGSIAKEIVKASQANGGILQLKDFNQYYIEELSPIACQYHNYQIISAPPPSSGGVTLCEILNILEGLPLRSLGYQSLLGKRYIIESMSLGFKDRNNQLGDPDFVENPVSKLISKKYADELRQSLFSKTNSGTPVHEGINTTHYSVMDKFGNAVSVTYTLNNYFGAGVIAGNTGFFLNDEMDDFAVDPGKPNQFGLVQGDKNNIQPGKRPLSSMTPTIVMKGNQAIMVLGSPGGPKIITSVLLTLLNVLDYGMNIQQAVNTKRFHNQWQPNLVFIEQNVFSPEQIKKLEEWGYHFTSLEKWGAVEAIYVDPVSKSFFGANDIRRPAGEAIGIH